MENTLNETLSKAVEKGLEIAEKSGQFVIDQAPELLQEFYNWHIASSIFFIFFSIFIVLIAYNAPKLWLSKDEKYYEINYFGRFGDESAIVAYVLFAISCLVSIVMFFDNVYNLVFILVAPKLYLIEYFIK